MESLYNFEDFEDLNSETYMTAQKKLFEKYPNGKHRNQANARERDRTQNVNSAFTILRSLIPTEPRDRKLSKIEILRLAGSYISHLANKLLSENEDVPCTQPYVSVERGTRNQVCTFCWSAQKKVN